MGQDAGVTQRGRPNDAEIAVMRLPRTSLFFIVSLGYAGVLTAGISAPAGFDQRPWGLAVLVLTLIVGFTSAKRTPLTTRGRITSLLLLGWVFSALLVLNCVSAHLQAAALLFYPAGTCWIEVTLTYMVMHREKEERDGDPG